MADFTSRVRQLFATPPDQQEAARESLLDEVRSGLDNAVEAQSLTSDAAREKWQHAQQLIQYHPDMWPRLPSMQPPAKPPGFWATAGHALGIGAGLTEPTPAEQTSPSFGQYMLEKIGGLVSPAVSGGEALQGIQQGATLESTLQKTAPLAALGLGHPLRGRQTKPPIAAEPPMARPTMPPSTAYGEAPQPTVPASAPPAPATAGTVAVPPEGVAPTISMPPPNAGQLGIGIGAGRPLTEAGRAPSSPTTGGDLGVGPPATTTAALTGGTPTIAVPPEPTARLRRTALEDLPVGEGEARGRWGALSRAADALAPDAVERLQRSGDPHAMAVGTGIQRTDLGRTAFLRDINSRAGPALSGIEKGSPLANQIGVALDTGQITGLPPEGLKAYSYLRAEYDRVANRLNIPYERRVSDYLPRLWDTNEVKTRLIDARKAMADAGQLTPAADEAIRAKLLEMERGNLTPRFNNLPRDVFAFFEQPRTGGKGYQTDAISAFSRYIDRAADVVYGRPLKNLVDREAVLIRDPDLRAFAEKRAVIAMSPDESGTAATIANTLRQYEYASKLALNPRWAQTNFLSGQIASISEIGPNAYRRGVQLSTNPEVRALFEQSGHTGTSTWREMTGGMTPSTVQSMASLGADKIEYFNRLGTWAGRLDDVTTRAGMPLDRLLESGQVPKAGWIDAADNSVRRAQAMYGKFYDPDYLRKPAARLVTQFASTPLKVAYGLKQPGLVGVGKVGTYAALGEALEEGLRALTGMDPGLANAVGIGVDFQGAAKDIAEGKPLTDIFEKRIAQEWAQGRGGLASLTVGPIVSTAKNLIVGGHHLVKAGWEGLKQAEGQPARPQAEMRTATRNLANELPVVGSRGVQAYEQATSGGTPGEAAGIMVGWRTPDVIVRDFVLRELRAGRKPSADAAMNEFQRAYGRPLVVDPTAYQSALEERQALTAEQKAFLSQTPRHERRLEALPPSTRRALSPP